MSQAIPNDPALLDTDSYKAFLVERRKLIAARLNEFLDSPSQVVIPNAPGVVHATA